MRCIGSPDETTNEHTTYEAVAPNNNSDELETSQAANISPPSSDFSGHLDSSKKIHVDVARTSGKRSAADMEISANLTRRGNAIAEMHARTKEQRKSRLDKAAMACT